jgi:hypothetical protein
VRRAFVVALLVALLAGRAGAMEILDFARLHLDDQASYVADLVEATVKSLRAQGHRDEADRVIALFHDSSKNGGVAQMALNLRKLHSENDRNATNPNNRTRAYTVEDALVTTLRDNGIQVSAPDCSRP